MKAVLLVSHGSKNKKCLKEIEVTTQKLQKQNTDCIVDYAFMELEKPSIPDGVNKLIQKGASEVLILLNFLNAGRHTLEDIPEIVSKVQFKNPNIPIRISSPIGQEEGMIDLFTKLIHEQ